MTVVEALETLHAQPASGRRAQVQAALVQALHQGQTLSKAMLGVSAFPQVLIAGVTASERTSTLVDALDDYLRYEEMMQRLRKQIVSAAIYPAVVVTLGLLIGGFLLMFVMPRFARMYGEVRGTVSGATAALLGLSRLVNEHTGMLTAAAITVVCLLVWLWQTGALMRALEWTVEAIEPLRRQWDHFRMAKLYQSLALMFKGGYTLDEALAVCEDLHLGVRVSEALRLARVDLLEGKTVSSVLSERGLSDGVATRLMAVGERSGGFATILQTIADRHAQAFTVFIERTTRLVEPLLLLLVALVVGGIIVMMYMPIFDIASGVR